MFLVLLTADKCMSRGKWFLMNHRRGRVTNIIINISGRPKIIVTNRVFYVDSKKTTCVHI